jgi:hypothetical protein
MLIAGNIVKFSTIDLEIAGVLEERHSVFRQW